MTYLEQLRDVSLASKFEEHALEDSVDNNHDIARAHINDDS